LTRRFADSAIVGVKRFSTASLQISPRDTRDRYLARRHPDAQALRGEGAQAERHARRRLAAEGNHDGTVTWRRITDAVLQLENTTPPGPVHDRNGPVTTRPPPALCHPISRMITSFSACGFPVNYSVQLFWFAPGAQLDIHSTAATQLDCIERSGPEASKRCAAGAGLDGDNACQATIVRAVIGVAVLPKFAFVVDAPRGSSLRGRRGVASLALRRGVPRAPSCDRCCGTS